MSAMDFFVSRSWWNYDAQDPAHQVYHYFNLGEGIAWIAFAALVLGRFVRHRHSWLEVAYAAAFFTFGLTDFREAYRLESWLILVKGANLVLLLWLRWLVIHRYYPASKLY